MTVDNEGSIFSFLPGVFISALQQTNGTRKAFQNGTSPTKGVNNIDDKYLEYKKKYAEFTKLKKILDLVKGMFVTSCILP